MDDNLLDDLFVKTEDTIVGEKHEFKEYIFNPKDFMGFSHMWYGTTGTGKTYHIRYCLNEVKHFFPRVVLFSPTNSISRDFTNIINDVMIIPELTEQKFLECIQAQKKIADTYRNIVNNIENLSKIFELCALQEEREQHSHMLSELSLYISNINYRSEPPNIKAQMIDDVKNKFNEKLILFYKYVIIPKRTDINISGLTPSEIECLRYIDMNPNTLFIFDDQQEEIIALSKKKNECSMEFKNLFTKGRHYFFTNWFTFQDDKALVPAARKSAKTAVFTDSASANAFITRSTNGFDKDSQKLGIELISNLYSGVSSQDHRKLVYFKDKSNNDRFQYSVAKNPGMFKVGSLAVNNFCNTLISK